MSDPFALDGMAIFQHATGFTLEADTETAINGATSVLIKYAKPVAADATGLQVTGHFTAHVHDATAGTIRHLITQTGDFDRPGFWRLWSYVTFPRGSLPGRSKLVRVFAEGDD